MIEFFLAWTITQHLIGYVGYNLIIAYTLNANPPPTAMDDIMNRLGGFYLFIVALFVPLAFVVYYIKKVIVN